MVKRKGTVLKRIAPTSTALDRFATRPQPQRNSTFRKGETVIVPTYEPKWVPTSPPPVKPELQAPSPQPEIDGAEILQRMLDKIAEDNMRRLKPAEPPLVKPVYMEDQSKGFDKADALLEELGIKGPEPVKRVLKFGDLLDQGGWKFKSRLDPTHVYYVRRGAIALIDQKGQEGMEVLFIQEKDGKLSYTHPKRSVADELRKLGASNDDQ